MASSPVLLIGATGMSGSSIGKYFVESGASVRAFLREHQTAASLGFSPSEIAQGSMSDLESLKSAMRGVAAVLYFVGTSVPATSNRDPQIEFDVTVPSLVNTLRAMEATATERIIFPSSGGTIYGQRLTPATEESECRPMSGYGLGKLLSEQCIQFYSRTTHIK